MEDNKFISELLQNWNLQHYVELFIEQEFTRDSFCNLQYECLSDLFPKAGPRNQFWAKYKSHFYPNQTYSECTTLSGTTYEDYQSITTQESNISASIDNVILVDLLSNDVESYLKCANGIIIKNYYLKYNALDNKNRNLLATLVISAEFNNFTDKSKFVIRTARFLELTAQITKVFPKEPEFLYYIPYNPETRSVAKGKLWESYNYLKKKLRNINKTDQVIENNRNTEAEVTHMEFLSTHFEPFEDIVEAWKGTFKIRQKMLESPISSTSIDEYFAKFPILKGESGISLILLDFKIKYSGYENKLIDNWTAISQKVIKVADAKQSPEIQLAKQQKSPDILLLCILPFLLPYAYLKKNKNGKRMKLTKHEILENIFIHVKDGNLLNEDIKTHFDKLKKYNLTFQPTVVFVGDTLDCIIASYVVINSILYKTESILAALDLCFKAFHVLNANYPEGSQLIWLFIQKSVYGLTTKYDLDFVSLNSLISQIS